jgi:hypothetical protein
MSRYSDVNVVYAAAQPRSRRVLGSTLRLERQCACMASGWATTDFVTS